MKMQAEQKLQCGVFCGPIIMVTASGELMYCSNGCHVVILVVVQSYNNFFEALIDELLLSNPSYNRKRKQRNDS